MSQQPYQPTLEQMRQTAAEAFADHVIRPISETTWICRKPGTGVYHFYVTIHHGWMIVYGDIGDVMFKVYGDEDCFRWIRSAARSPGYFLEKLAPTMPRRRYCKERGLDYLKYLRDEVFDPEDDHYADARKAINEVLEATWAHGDEHEMVQKVYDDLVCENFMESEDIDSFYDFDYACYWGMFALIRFVELFDAGRIEGDLKAVETN